MAKGYANYPRLKFGAPTRPKTKPAVDPFQQQTPQQINQTVQGYVNRLPRAQTPQEINQQVNRFRHSLPAPLTNQQIQQRATAALDPVIAKITAAVNARAASQQQAVRGYTNQVAQQLAAGAHTLSDPYQQAAQQSAAATQALSDRIQSGGQQTGGDLAAKLAALNAPAVGQTAARVGQEGVGAGNALYATGNADIQELLKNAASAGSYGAKLPGIARLGGIEQAGLVGRQAVTDIADQVAQAEGQLPTIVQNLRSMSEDRAQNRASLADRIYEYLTSQGQTAQTNRGQLASDLYGTLTGQNITRATAQAGFQNDQTTANQPQVVTSGGGIYSVDPNTGAVTTQVAPPAPTPPEPKAPTTRSTKAGLMQYDPNTKTWELVPGTAPPAPADDPKVKEREAKARQSALVKADSTVRSILTRAAKPITVQTPSTNPFLKGTSKKVKPPVGSAAYNAAVNQAVTSLSTILGPYLTQDQIVQFVQARAKTVFAPAQAAPAASGKNTNSIPDATTLRDWF